LEQHLPRPGGRSGAEVVQRGSDKHLHHSRCTVRRPARSRTAVRQPGRCP